MRVWLLATALSQWLGCVTQPAPSSPTAMVKQLEVDFPARDRGRVTFAVRLPASAVIVRSVTWELFVDGVRMATGVEANPQPRDGEVTISSTLVTRHLSWREGDAALDVGIRGEIDVGLPEPVGFRDRRDVAVHGRPLLNIPSD